MDALKDRIYHTLYATNHPPRTRTQPMQVIAVGISRSATESLQHALHTLGIEHVWHGYDSILPPYCLEEWYKLVVKKWRSPPSEVSMKDGLRWNLRLTGRYVCTRVDRSLSGSESDPQDAE